MHDAPVFLITTGRTGSTLLQRLLKCHPDLVMWGEHHGLFAALAGPYMQMAVGESSLYPLTAQGNRGPGLLLPDFQYPWAALEWANPYSLEEVKQQVAGFMKGFFASRLAPEQRWGFKEVRYNQTEALDMLHDVFPQGQFVFLRRNPLEVTRSIILTWKKDLPWDALPLAERLKRTDSVLQEIRSHYAVYDEFMVRNPGACIAIDYERLVEDCDATLATILSHLRLDPSRYDQALAAQVFDRVIASTKS
jgi:hypothetical protein